MLKHNLCIVCQKEGGICNCAGCQACFCTKDFQAHRQWLSEEFEKVVEVRNEFQEEINERKQVKQLQTSLLYQINQWEIFTIEKVRYAAEKTRQEIIQLLIDKIKDIESEFDNVTKQLCNLQRLNNYVEDDLVHVKNNIQNLQKKFRYIAKSPSLKLNEEQSEHIDWTSIIHVNDGKVNVCCLFADTKCSWTGPRDQLGQHLVNCSSGSLRTKVHKFHNINEQLKEQTKQQKDWIDKNEFEIGQLKQQLKQRDIEINRYEIEIHQLKEQIKKQNSEINNNEVKIRRIRERLKQRNIQINKNNNTILLLKEQLVQKSVQIDTNETQINKFKEEIKQQKILIETKEAKTEQLKQKKVQINTNENSIHLLREQLLRKHEQIKQIGVYDFQIRQTIKQARRWKSQLMPKIIEIQRLKTQLQERQTDISLIKIQHTKKENHIHNNVKLANIIMLDKISQWYYHYGSTILILILIFILILNVYSWISNDQAAVYFS